MKLWLKKSELNEMTIILYFSKGEESFLCEVHYMSGSKICEILASVVFCKTDKEFYTTDREI